MMENYYDVVMKMLKNNANRKGFMPDAYVEGVINSIQREEKIYVEVFGCTKENAIKLAEKALHDFLKGN